MGQYKQLRHEPLVVSLGDSKEVFKLNQYSRPLNYIKNDFEDRGEIVYDCNTGLMWQKSGSDDCLDYWGAGSYVNKLNKDGFAGYSDWRLPTVDELASLVVPGQRNGDLYIDLIFDEKCRFCWTADRGPDARTDRVLHFAWSVDFYNSGLVRLCEQNSDYYVRVCRS